MKLRYRALVAAQLVAMVALTTGVLPKLSDAQQVATAEATEGVLSFRISHGYLILFKGEIGKQTGLRFILDTGATISIVDRKIADRVKLKGRAAESFNFDRKIQWEQATVPDIRFGPVTVEHADVLVGNLAEYSDFADDADAIIGLDLLARSNVTIDYASKKILFHSLRTASTTVRVAEASRAPAVEVQMRGCGLRLMVDTGTPGILLFEERFLDGVPGFRFDENPMKVTIGGRLHARQTVLHGLTIGSRSEDVSVLLAKAPEAGVMPGIAGVVGIAPLNAKRVNFDFASGSFSWE